ncbi:MAG: hypothetical protein RIS65_1097 [Pseudomonadota bacterium]
MLQSTLSKSRYHASDGVRVSDTYVVPSATILTMSNPDYLDKPLKYMVSPAGFEPATY